MARKRSHTRGKARTHPQGRIELHRAGYGFVQTAEGEFFIPRKQTHGAFPDDVVEIVPIKRASRGKPCADRKQMARVVRVLERAHDEIIGYFRHAEPFGVVEPVDPLIKYDVFTQLCDHSEIPDGAVVRVAIVTFPDRKTAATGKVIEVLDDEDNEHVMIDLIIMRHKLETEFSTASRAEADNAMVDADEALIQGYSDLRSRFVFTIDPSDARDYDDAVSIEKVTLPCGSPGWRLGVHIADVSYYVPWDSQVDLDARRRATSIYLADRVIPMLPEKLSNDICSLRPGEVRRTMTVDLLVNESGEVVSAKPYLALIQSRFRLTYDEVQASLDSLRSLGSDLDVRIAWLSKIAQQRALLRNKAGGLDFDTIEAKVRLDNEGFPLDIVLREKTDATQLIEEAMIAANEAVAQFLNEKKSPCLFRIHEQPSPDALEGLVPVFAEFGWFKNISESKFIAGNSREVQKVLAAAKNRPESVLVTTLILRSMKRAIYSPHIAMHYGLASQAYVHFTSPIRRYPDLVVHRMLRAVLKNQPKQFGSEVTSLSWLAEHSSEMERIADRVARESQEVKIIEYMEAFLGETFPALISGVTTSGLFVRLDNTAEGMVEVADLGREYFLFDPIRYILTGSDTGKQFRLGQRIVVRVVEANCRLHRLRFRLA